MTNVIANQTVNNQVNNEFKNNLNMNQEINFANVCGEVEVAKTTTVDSTTVQNLLNAFLRIPTSVVVKFQNSKGYLYMTTEMTFEGNSKYSFKYQTYADLNLVEKMLCSMGNPKMVGCLSGYNVEEHPLEASEVDPRIELFRQFLNSPFKCSFDKDFTPNPEESYIQATFRVGYKKEVKFCLKRTAEIEEIINNAIQAA